MVELLFLVLYVEANVQAYLGEHILQPWANEPELRRLMWNNVVGCRTCGDRGYIVVGQSWADPYGEPESCPDCL